MLGGGFAEAVTPLNLLLCLTGVMLGTVVGVLPGLGTAMAIALLVPVTFQLDPTGAFIMFAGVYFGGQFGGATTAILLNTPGQSSSMATAFEGFLMAKNRRAPQALATAVLGSFLSSIVAVTLVVFFSPLMVNLAVGFGPPEYFALTVLAFLATSAVVTGDMLRGLSSLGIGLAVAMVGIDEQSGAVRFTLGSTQLLDGISVVVVTVGLLAIGEVLHVASRSRRAPATETVASGRPWLSRRDLGRSWRPWLRGTALGVPFGVIPAGGAEIPTFLSYGAEKSLSKRRGDSEFDRGAIEGVAGPEAANNATTATSLVPLLGLGLPTSATAAIMLGAFQQYGMRPGPLLFTQESDLVWALLASLFHRQRDAAGAEPAVRTRLGKAVAHPAQLPLRGNRGVRHPRGVHHQVVGVRRAAVVRDRGVGLPAAPLRLPDRSGAHRGHPRAAGRDVAAPCDGDEPGRRRSARGQSLRGGALLDPGAGHGGLVRAARAQPTPSCLSPDGPLPDHRRLRQRR